MKKKFFLLSLLMAVTMMASADVVKTIGTGGTYDYPSLYAACVDLKASPLTANTVWEICTDLTEHLNAGIINNTEYSLTIRPNADADRVITFDAENDNTGPSGNFVIGGNVIAGLTDDNAANIPWEGSGATTKNIVIDGYADGGITRRLTIKGGNVGGTAILIYGDVTNTTIKNCIVENTRPSGSGYDVTIRTKKSSDDHPVGIVFDNCKFISTKSSAGQCFNFNSTQKSTTAGFVENTIIRNCEFVVKQRGIFVQGLKNLDVLNCNFKVNQPGAGNEAYGIYGYSQARGIINVKNNYFEELKSTGYSAEDARGICGIAASSGATVWNIENNIFAGIDALPCSDANVKYSRVVAVRCGDSCVVRHNTFKMPVLSRHPLNSLTSANPIALLYLAGSKHYIVENNIFVSEEATAINSLIRTSAPMDNVKNNVLFHNDGNAYIIGSAAPCQDMAAYEAMYPAAASTWKEVQFNADMSLAAASIGDQDMAVAKINDVATDINGKERLDPTYAGAEAPGFLADVEHLYVIGSNQAGGWAPNVGTELVKVSENVFKYDVNITGETYFAFVTDLANATGDEAWAYVNARRFGADVNDKVLAKGDNVDLVKGTNAFQITAAGFYTITIDLNVMKAEVSSALAKVSIAGTFPGATAWSTNLYVLTEANDHLSASKTIHLDAGSYQFKVVRNDAEWLSTGTTDQIDRRYNTKSNLETGHGNYNFIADIAGDYEFVFTYADNSLDITFPDFVREANNTNYQSLCTPFDATVVGATAYELVSADGSGVNVRSVDELVAGHSYLLKPDAIGDIAINYVADGAITLTPVNPDASTTGFFGELVNTWTYQYDDPEQANWRNFFVLLDDDMFHQVRAGGEVTITPTHAYLRIAGDEIVDPTSAPIRIIENATNIQNIEGQEKAVKFIQNGQIYIQKNGVVYDAMGRVIR